MILFHPAHIGADRILRISIICVLHLATVSLSLIQYMSGMGVDRLFKNKKLHCNMLGVWRRADHPQLSFLRVKATTTKCSGSSSETMSSPAQITGDGERHRR